MPKNHGEYSPKHDAARHVFIPTANPRVRPASQLVRPQDVRRSIEMKENVSRARRPRTTRWYDIEIAPPTIARREAQRRVYGNTAAQTPNSRRPDLRHVTDVRDLERQPLNSGPPYSRHVTDVQNPDRQSSNSTRPDLRHVGNVRNLECQPSNPARPDLRHVTRTEELDHTRQAHNVGPVSGLSQQGLSTGRLKNKANAPVARPPGLLLQALKGRLKTDLQAKANEIPKPESNAAAPSTQTTSSLETPKQAVESRTVNSGHQMPSSSTQALSLQLVRSNLIKNDKGRVDGRKLPVPRATKARRQVFQENLKTKTLARPGGMVSAKSNRRPQKESFAMLAKDKSGSNQDISRRSWLLPEVPRFKDIVWPVLMEVNVAGHVVMPSSWPADESDYEEDIALSLSVDEDGDGGDSPLSMNRRPVVEKVFEELIDSGKLVSDDKGLRDRATGEAVVENKPKRKPKLKLSVRGQHGGTAGAQAFAVKKGCLKDAKAESRANGKPTGRASRRVRAKIVRFDMKKEVLEACERRHRLPFPI
ncbi:hypothetical protein BCR34DRAFT_582299 [Clohesyomyces aquaticus]|uniref:Uncharacterized protein n=1 Tax=Clohesyomyces aquaticus TaxID=1231657 RepID=A0A1Y2AAS5_9PLEO|nr:hypothetical protein BCR34DRAFT_582299 [Clohesyomyces aquaticus]